VSDAGVPVNPAEPLRIDVLRGAASEEELAALLAVVSEAYEREAAAAVVADVPASSAWTRTRRRLRSPLPRGGAWGRYIG
jgi:hypothetical protein